MISGNTQEQFQSSNVPHVVAANAHTVTPPEVTETKADVGAPVKSLLTSALANAKLTLDSIQSLNDKRPTCDSSSTHNNLLLSDDRNSPPTPALCETEEYQLPISRLDPALMLNSTVSENCQSRSCSRDGSLALKLSSVSEKQSGFDSNTPFVHRGAIPSSDLRKVHSGMPTII